MEKRDEALAKNLIAAIERFDQKKSATTRITNILGIVSLVIGISLGVFGLMKYYESPSYAMKMDIINHENRLNVVEDYMRKFYPETKERIQDPYRPKNSTRGLKLQIIYPLFINHTEYDYRNLE